MSNALAIATVTSALRRLVLGPLGADLPGALVTTLRPDSSSPLPETGVNLYLYQVTPNTAWRNHDLPARSARGELLNRPRVALDLHYLFSFYGAEATLEPQRALASVARTLHAHAPLTREDIESTITSTPFLAGSDLHQEPERVKLTAVPLSLEELSKLWSVLLQTPYALSMVYEASVVFVDARERPRAPLPVTRRHIDVLPFQRAVIERIVNADGEFAPIELGSTIRILGTGLAGEVDHVQVGRASLAPLPAPISNEERRVTLTHPELRAGVASVQVHYAQRFRSTVGAFVLRPQATVDQASVTSSVLPIDFVPNVDAGQQVSLFLNQRDAAALPAPLAYLFDAPENNGVVAPATSTSRIEFPIGGVGPGEYLVRVQVDGAENTLSIGMLSGREQFIDPHAVIP